MASTANGIRFPINVEYVENVINEWAIRKQKRYAKMQRMLEKAGKATGAKDLKMTLEFFKLLRNFETFLVKNIKDILVENGLDVGSNLVKTIDVGYKNKMFEVLAQDYYQYVSKGRKPRARKIPVEALIQWIKDKNLPYRGSINSAAFAIQQSIYKKGIQGQLFEEEVIGFSTMAIDEMLSTAVAIPTQYGLEIGWMNFKDTDLIQVTVGGIVES